MADIYAREHTEVACGATGRPVLQGGYTHGIVASGHYLTSIAAIRLLLTGGNAFDAAAAAGSHSGVLMAGAELRRPTYAIAW